MSRHRRTIWVLRWMCIISAVGGALVNNAVLALYFGVYR
jgi:hypothetical protein